MTSDLQPITHPLLTEAGVRHGFFTRQGGVSTGLYDSLNTGVGSRDDAAAVQENRRRIAAHFGAGPEELAACYQIHSAITHVAKAPWKGERPEGDAVATAVPGIVCGVLTADCAPILLADPEAGVVGAAHAGWKGALGGVVQSVVSAMQELGAEPSRILAVVGPCIAQASYEVGADYEET
jgi:YfiH family protein